jgi:hypothetical protein
MAPPGAKHGPLSPLDVPELAEAILQQLPRDAMKSLRLVSKSVSRLVDPAITTVGIRLVTHTDAIPSSQPSATATASPVAIESESNSTPVVVVHLRSSRAKDAAAACNYLHERFPRATSLRLTTTLHTRSCSILARLWIKEWKWYVDPLLKSIHRRMHVNVTVASPDVGFMDALAVERAAAALHYW